MPQASLEPNQYFDIYLFHNGTGLACVLLFCIHLKALITAAAILGAESIFFEDSLFPKHLLPHTYHNVKGGTVFSSDALAAVKADSRWVPGALWTLQVRAEAFLIPFSYANRLRICLRI